MKQPLYYLLCAIACTSMVGATMPMAAIADAIQPQATAEQQSQAGATSSDTAKAEDDTNTNATADTVEDSTATSAGTTAANTESADATTAATGSTTRRSPSWCKTKASTGTETWTSTKHRQRTSYSNKLPSVVFCNSSTNPIWFNTCLIAYVSTYLIRSSVSSLMNRLNSFSVR